MKTQFEKNQANLVNYQRQELYDTTGQHPCYIVDATNTLRSQTEKNPYYIRAEEGSTSFIAYNELTNTNLTRTSIADGKDYWGDFSTLTVSAGSVLVYVK